MEFRVLGSLRVVDIDGVEVRLASRAQRRLVSVLLVYRDQVVPADRLADHLALSGGALRTSVSRLRRLLGDNVVVTDGAGYRIRADRLDADDFERLLADSSVGRSADDPVGRLRSALDLWRGDPYGEFSGEAWVRVEAHRLGELRSGALEALAAELIERGESSAALSALDGLMAAEPYRDRPRALVMRALAGSGRRVEALRLFHTYRRTLLDEVGTEPSEEIVSLEREIAAAGSSPRRSDNTLPTPSSSFVGRVREVGVVRRLVSDHRLVTLTGAGGIGKSRVAVRVAEELLDAHPGGTWYVELARAARTGTVAEEVARSIGAAAVPGGSLAPVAERIVAAGRCLIVFDNAEHVLAGVASVVGGLLDRCPDLHVLITSREPLDLGGEHVWRLPLMTTPSPGAARRPDDLQCFDATTLFLDRMRSARPDLVVDSETAALVAAICVRLDGLPLALELAAARTRTLQLRWILAGLDNAMAILDPATDGADRHHSLRASIAWSVDLLEPCDREALGRLSVFRSPFTADAAAAVVGEGAGTVAVLPVLVRLCDKSLIQFNPRTGRYHLLETIRHHCVTTLLDDDLREATSRRHCTWFARWCQEVGEGLHGIDRSPVLAEVPDVVAAMEWARRHDAERAMQMCIGLGSIRTTLGHHDDLLATWDWLLGPDGPPRTPRWASAVTALMAAATGARLDVQAIVPAVEEHLRPNDERARGWLARGRAMVPAYCGDLEPVIDYAASVTARGDDVEASVYLGFAAYMLALAGRVAEAERCLRHLHHVARRHSTRFGVDTIGNGFAAQVLLTGHAGRLTEAIALGDAPTPDDPAFSMTAAAALAQCAMMADDALALERAHGWGRRGTIPLLRFLTPELELYRALAGRDAPGAAAAAEAYWAQSVSVPLSRLHRCAVVNHALLLDGRFDQATAIIHEAETMVESMRGVPWLEAVVHQAKAQLACAEGRTDEHLHHATVLLALAEKHGFALLGIDAQELMAIGLRRTGDQSGSHRLMAAATSARQRTGYRFVIDG